MTAARIIKKLQASDLDLTIKDISYHPRTTEPRRRSELHIGKRIFIREEDKSIGSGAYSRVYPVIDSEGFQVLIKKGWNKGDVTEIERRNWQLAEGFGYLIEKADDCYLVIPDLATETTKTLAKLKYQSIHDLLATMLAILTQLKIFHATTQLVHLDLTENNILCDANHKIKFVDLGFARLTDKEEVPNVVCHIKNHQGNYAGYFPPELKPELGKSIDKKAKFSHDIYMAGRLLSEMLKMAKGQKLNINAYVEEDLNDIILAMKAPVKERISLDVAIDAMQRLQNTAKFLPSCSPESSPDFDAADYSIIGRLRVSSDAFRSSSPSVVPRVDNTPYGVLTSVPVTPYSVSPIPRAAATPSPLKAMPSV